MYDSVAAMMMMMYCSLHSFSVVDDVVDVAVDVVDDVVVVDDDDVVAILASDPMHLPQPSTLLLPFFS